jgi:hypothetical protein
VGGSTTISTSATRIEALRFQSSAYGIAIPVVFGVTRIPGNLMWYGGFKATAHTTTTSQGGKGGGGVRSQNTTYTYSASMALGLCEGPVIGVPRVWRGKEVFSGGITPAQIITVTENYAVPLAGGTYTVAQAAAFRVNVGVEAPTGGGENGSAPSPLAEGYHYTRAGGAYTFPQTIGQGEGATGNFACGQTVTITYQYLQAGATQSALTKLGLSLFSGQLGQATWSHLTAAYPSQAIGYSGIAYLAGQDYQLGESAQVENHNVEVQAQLAYTVGATVADADPADIAAALLTNLQWGARFPATKLGTLDAYSDYCRAAGLLLSPALLAQRAASEILADLVKLTNSDLVWSDQLLKFVPLGDANLSGNGRTYTANVTPVYDLTVAHFLAEPGQPPVRVRRKRPSDRYNHVRVEFVNRANQYAVEVAEWKDQADIEASGLRSMSPVQAHWINEAAVAALVARLLGQRSLYVAATYEFSLPWNFALLEPAADLVTLTEPDLALDRWPVRITEIEEDESGELRVVAEDFPLGIASAPDYGTQGVAGWFHDYNAVPGDVQTPVLFEAPVVRTTTGLEVYAAVTGTSLNWGGCRVWVSLDNLTYREVATVDGGARFGSLRSALAAGPGGTAAVQLAGLGGQIIAGSAADADNTATLCWVGDAAGGEYFAHEGAALVAANQYDLTGLRRGLFSNPAPARSAGAQFVRVDATIARSGPLDLSLIGKTLWFKFTSFNQYGGGEQSLADVTAIPYTVTGAQAKLPPSNVTAATATLEEFGIRIKVTPVPDGDVNEYVARQGGTDFASAGSLDGPETVFGPEGYLWRVQSAGAKVIRLKARDALRNLSSGEFVLNITVPAPQSTGLTATINGRDVRLAWTGVPGVTAIRQYVVEYDAGGGTWVEWDRVDAAYSERRANWLGTRTFRVYAIDAAGNVGATSSTSVGIAAPAAPVVSVSVLTNRVIITTGDPQTTLPIERIELRRGAVGVAWASATLIGVLGPARLANFEETIGGSYDYLLRATDSAGNESADGRQSAVVADPPGFRRFSNYDGNFSLGTRTNVLIEAATGKLLAPFNTTETEAQHYSTRSWSTDQDKINAGYAYVAHPTNATGSYEETLDFGSVVSGAKIDLTLTSQPLVGSVTVQPRISYKLNIGDAWTDGPLGTASLFATNFRYVKYRFEFTSQANASLNQYGVLSCDKFNGRLSTERKTDTGSSTVTSTDSGGTLVTFNRTDFDVPPVVTPSSGEAGLGYFAEVDHGATTKTTCRLYLFDAGGVRRSGKVNWSAEQGT